MPELATGPGASDHISPEVFPPGLCLPRDEVEARDKASCLMSCPWGLPQENTTIAPITTTIERNTISRSTPRPQGKAAATLNPSDPACSSSWAQEVSDKSLTCVTSSRKIRNFFLLTANLLRVATLILLQKLRPNYYIFWEISWCSITVIGCHSHWTMITEKLICNRIDFCLPPCLRTPPLELVCLV